MKAKLKTITALSAMLALAGTAFGADYSSWARYRNVTVNTSAMTLGSAVTNVPVLVRFNATNQKDMLDSATQILANGADIRVTKADGTTDVPFEIETATTGATGTAALWILADNVAQSSASAATFRVYWGKTGVTTLSNSSAVFDTANGFVAVWHMNGLTDATVNGYALSGATPPAAAASTDAMIGDAKTFVAASTQFYNISSPGNTAASGTTLNLNVNNGPYTITAWVKPTTCPSGRMTVIAKYDGAGSAGTRQWALQTKNTAANWGMSNDPNLTNFTTGATSNEYVADAAGSCVANTPVYLAGSYFSATTPDTGSVNGGAAKLRFQANNGAPVTSAYGNITAGQNGTAALPFIGKMQGTAPRYMNGTLDEITVSKVQRDTNWVEVSYETQKATVTAVTIGAAQIPAPASVYGAWSGHRTIVLNTSATGANVAGDVAGFPVLVRLGAGEASVFSAAKTGGADLRFSKANDSTALPYEIESWNAAGTSAAIWVKVDTVKGNNAAQTIRMHWGNASAAAESNGPAVFDTSSGFASVWHLGATTGTVRPNSTPGAPDAATVGFAGGYTAPAGLIGLADSTTGGVCDAIDNSVGNKPHLDLNPARGAYSRFDNLGVNGYTWSGWFYDVTAAGGARYFQSYTDSTVPGANGRVVFFRPNPATNILNGRIGTTTANAGSAYLSAGGGAAAWQLITIVKMPGNSPVKFYNNGDSISASANVSITEPASSRKYQVIGRPPCASGSTGDNYYGGKIDEVEYSNTVRSTDWVKLSFQNQKAASTFTDIGLPVVVTAPGAPTTVTGVAGNAQVAVTWVAPASNGGSAITGYTASAVSDTSKKCTTAALTCTVSGLTNGTAYTFTVTATNAIGTSPASAASAAVTPTAAATAPGAPTTVTGVAGNAQVAVTWVAPASNGGSAITSYKAAAVADTTKSCTTANGTTLTCTVAGLTNGTAYTFTVKAINVVGASVASTASAAVTPITVAGAPTSPTATAGAAGSGQATIVWVAPASNGGSAITSYTVAANDTSKKCTTANGTTLTCTVTGLTNGTAYTFTVIATNAAGKSAASVASNSVTPPVSIAPGSFVIAVNQFSSPYTFRIPEGAAAYVDNLTMTITDAWGRTVWERTVNPAANKLRELSWNGVNASGTKVSAGMYIVRIQVQSGGKTEEVIQKNVDLAPR